MDSGRIAEQGTHDQLLAADGTYTRLYHAQFAHVRRAATVARGERRVPAAETG